MHLLQHESGKLMRESAKEYLNDQGPKLRCKAILSEVNTLLTDICSLATTPGPCDKTSLAEKANAIFASIDTVNAEYKLSKTALVDAATLCSPILEKLLDHYASKVASAYASAVAWVTGEASEPSSWQDHAHIEERLSDRLEAFAAVVDLETFKREELAYEHSVHIVMHACTGLRPSAQAPGTTMDRFASSAKELFQTYPAQRLHEGEELGWGQWGGADVPHWTGIAAPWKVLYKAIEAATFEMGSSRTLELCELLHRMRGADTQAFVFIHWSISCSPH
jgi:hypothetical protein